MIPYRDPESEFFLDKARTQRYAPRHNLSNFRDGSFGNDGSQRQTRMASEHGPGEWEPVVHDLPCGCLVLDPRGVVCCANPIALDLLSVEAFRLLDHPLLDVVSTWKGTSFADVLTGTLIDRTRHEATAFELPVSNDRWVAVRLSTTEQREEQFLLCILTEITEQVRLRKRLRWTEYQASVGKLARGIAHELSNPLDGVLRYTHLALEQAGASSPVHQYLLQVKDGLDRMVRATRAFLEFSRQATAPVTRAANVNQLIDDVLVLFRHHAKFQQIEIVARYDPALPPIVDGGLQHAIVNLIKNAFDAMPSGGTLRITTRRENGYVQLAVEDTGLGIAEDVQPRMFEPFFSTKPIHKGNGLGLVIAKEVVERSGGTIVFTSRVGVGTTFVIQIPVNADEGTG